jgi:hypothetical protein
MMGSISAGVAVQWQGIVGSGIGNVAFHVAPVAFCIPAGSAQPLLLWTLLWIGTGTVSIPFVMGQEQVTTAEALACRRK